ncbi:MAG TPA: sugar kinase [Planctomycetes bacterium]|nr:sugar kinase [Planctomycetota bacterium]
MLTPNVVPDFTALRVAVAGDLIVDRYVYARPTRLSREAPVIVMRHAGEELGAGGAANVARNLCALGTRTTLIGTVGRDAMGRELIRLLETDEVSVEAVHSSVGYTTPTKTRILGAEPGRTMHQVLRIDREPDHPVPLEERERVARDLRTLEGRIDALLVSDYGYGLVDENVGAAARRIRDAGGVVVLDPRADFELLSGATAMTPNLAELANAVGKSIDQMADFSEVVRAANELLERARPEWLLVTMGNRGMALFSEEERAGVTTRPAGAESVIDVSGAGDTAAAVFTLALAAGLEGPRAMRLANTAAGVVVMEHGTAVCPLSTLRSTLPVAPQPSRNTAVAAELR